MLANNACIHKSFNALFLWPGRIHGGIELLMVLLLPQIITERMQYGHLIKYIFASGGMPNWPVILCAAISHGLFGTSTTAASVVTPIHITLYYSYASSTLQGWESRSTARYKIYMDQLYQLTGKCRLDTLEGKPQVAM